MDLIDLCEIPRTYNENCRFDGIAECASDCFTDPGLKISQRLPNLRFDTALDERTRAGIRLDLEKQEESASSRLRMRSTEIGALAAFNRVRTFGPHWHTHPLLVPQLGSVFKDLIWKEDSFLSSSEFVELLYGEVNANQGKQASEALWRIKRSNRTEKAFKLMGFDQINMHQPLTG